MALDFSENDVPTISDLIESAIARGAASSYRDLARQLKVHNTALREWKADRAHPKNDVAIRLAKLAGRDPVEVLAIVNYWRSKPADRIYLQRMLRYIRAGLAAAFLFFLVLPDAAIARNFSCKSFSDLYIMRVTRNGCST